MKIGQLTNMINEKLANENQVFSISDYITSTKINGYNKMGLISPELKKNKDKSYYEFEDVHFRLILNAYRKIIFYHMRTRKAFLEVKNELNSPTLFER